MAKPAFLRYLPARLKPLGKPAVWAPLTVFALLSTLLWEYHKNPDWFNRQPVRDFTPASSLSPEEEARLSEIDTLEVLLNGSRASDDTKTVKSQINPDVTILESSSDEADSEASAASGTGDSRTLLEKYPIPGTASTERTFSPNQSQSSQSAAGLPGRSSGLSNASSIGATFDASGLSNSAGAPVTSSALADALNRREAARAAAQNAPDSEARSQPSLPSSGASNSVGQTQTGLTSQPVPGAFIRTTPDMSPPVGTTGYRPPATSALPTFNVVPPQPTRSPYSGASGVAAQQQRASQSGAGQFRVPTVAPIGQGSLGQSSSGQGVPAPARVAPPSVGAPAVPPGSLYTAPTSVQPDQGRPINPRR